MKFLKKSGYAFDYKQIIIAFTQPEHDTEMQVVKNTGIELIIRQNPTVARLFSGFALIICLSALNAPSLPPDEQLAANVGALGLASFCLVFFLSLKTTTWVFEKSNQTLAVQSKRLFLVNTAVHALQEIKEVQVDRRDTESGEIFTIKLIFSDGNCRQLCPRYSLSETTAKDGAYQISAFLGVPFTSF